MDIFISWHAKRGNRLAVALQEWLPQIANAFNPWSSSSTDKGSRWRTEVATRLEEAKAGIIILTPSALTAPWLLFEAGAIAKNAQKTYACTLLVDLKSEDVTDPLAQFQHTKVNDREEMLKLVKTLNNALDKDKRADPQIEKSFDKWWPDLEQQIKNLPADEPTKVPHRDDRDLLAEAVKLARATSAQVNELSSVLASHLVTTENAVAANSFWSPTASGALVNLVGNPVIPGVPVVIDTRIPHLPSPADTQQGPNAVTMRERAERIGLIRRAKDAKKSREP